MSQSLHPRTLHRSPLPPPRWAKITLWILIILFSVYFTALAFNLHAAHRTHMADLGQIDLAIWNTSQGRFVQEIKGEQISTRLTDHVEPIFAPVSLVFYLWNDVRALLALAGSRAVALGAWPVFYLAWGRLGKGKSEVGDRTPSDAVRASRTQSRAETFRALASLAFVVAYLLYPSLQAALVAEFHAMPLATPLILLAFLFIERHQWGRFAVAALLVAFVQEGAALLTALLGLYALARALQLRRTASHSHSARTRTHPLRPSSPAPSSPSPAWPGSTSPPSSSSPPTPPRPTVSASHPTPRALARWATASATWRALC